MAVTWKKLAYEDDVILKTLTTTTGDIIYASANNTPNRLGIGTQNYVLTAGATIPSWATPAAPTAHQASHSPQDGSDALDCAAPAELAGIQAAGEGNADTLARSNHAHQIQESMADNHLVTINQADVASADIAVFTATGGLGGQTPSEVAATMALDDIGTPDALVDFNLQEAHKLVVQTVADDTAKDALAAAATEVGQLLWVTADLDLWVCTVSAV